ncbi:MAG: hypothetical protein HQ488_00660 [Parcubacteria group bacterium]|nr:hypothetical protein [Parcubacteria group bacterium]
MPTKKKAPKAAAKKPGVARSGSAGKPAAKKRSAKKPAVAKKPRTAGSGSAGKAAPKKKVVVKKTVAKKKAPAKKKTVAKKKAVVSKSIAKEKIDVEAVVDQVIEEALENNMPVMAVSETKLTSNDKPVEVLRKIVYIGTCRNCDHMPMKVGKLVGVLSFVIAILSVVVIFGGPSLDTAIAQLGLADIIQAGRSYLN